MTDPYLTGLHQWWHTDSPSPELLAAEAEGDLGTPGVVIDFGCGLGTEIGYLASRGWLRMCLNSAGVPNGLGAETIETAFPDWKFLSLRPVDLASDTRTMPALQALLSRPARH